MQTQKVNIRGVIVWITILHPMLETEGRTYPSNKFVIYYNFYEPANNYYGKLLCNSYELMHEPLTCEDMNEAIECVECEIDKRFIKKLYK